MAKCVAGEYGSSALLIQGPAGGQRDHPSRVQSRESDPPGEAAKNNLNTAGGLGLLCECVDTFFLNFMSCLLNLDHRDMLYLL